MRAIVYTLIFVFWFVGLGLITVNAQFAKDTGMFKPRKDAPIVMRIDDKRSLHISDSGPEEWIFCVFKTEFEERLDAVIIMKTEKAEYADKCPIMLVISDRVGDKNSIEFSVAVGEAQQTLKIPILYMTKEYNQDRKWLRQGYRRMVLSQQEQEGVTHYQ
ncbi:MAG: hypothetical protein IT410_00570 [Candidatus Doudnabacteria bacterium]|nr:hypothetical protein [Candidatus Doudnabacteria bacterium]